MLFGRPLARCESTSKFAIPRFACSGQSVNRTRVLWSRPRTRTRKRGTPTSTSTSIVLGTQVEPLASESSSGAPRGAVSWANEDRTVYLALPKCSVPLGVYLSLAIVRAPPTHGSAPCGAAHRVRNGRRWTTSSRPTSRSGRIKEMRPGTTRTRSSSTCNREYWWPLYQRRIARSPITTHGTAWIVWATFRCAGFALPSAHCFLAYGLPGVCVVLFFFLCHISCASSL